MLVKEFCQRCHDLNRFRKWSRCPAKDRDWARGRVACVMLWKPGNGHRYLKINDLPPKNCPFIVEQLVNSRP